MELYLTKLEDNIFKEVRLSKEMYDSDLKSDKSFTFCDDPTDSKILYIAKISSKFYFGESLNSISEKSNVLLNKQCLLKLKIDDKNYRWSTHRIESCKGLFVILSNSSLIHSLSDIYLLDSFQEITIDMLNIITLPLSLISSYYSYTINDFSQFRLNQLISQVKQYSNLISYSINPTKTKLIIIGDCKSIAEVIDSHYNEINNKNKDLNLIKYSEPKKVSKKPEESKAYICTNILYEKYLYDKIKPKIESLKKQNIKFEIKNAKDNQIKVSFYALNDIEITNIKKEIEIKREYFELLLNRQHRFISQRDFPSLNFLLEEFEFDSFEVEAINEDLTGVEIVGKVDDINRFKALIRIYLDSLQKEKEIREEILKIDRQIDNSNLIN